MVGDNIDFREIRRKLFLFVKNIRINEKIDCRSVIQTGTEFVKLNYSTLTRIYKKVCEKIE